VGPHCLKLFYMFKYKIAKLTMCETQIIVQKAITKSSAGHHGPPTNAKAGSDAMEE
jgi:hypothetical protein